MQLTLDTLTDQVPPRYDARLFEWSSGGGVSSLSKLAPRAEYAHNHLGLTLKNKRKGTTVRFHLIDTVRDKQRNVLHWVYKANSHDVFLTVTND